MEILWGQSKTDIWVEHDFTVTWNRWWTDLSVAELVWSHSYITDYEVLFVFAAAVLEIVICVWSFWSLCCTAGCGAVEFYCIMLTAVSIILSNPFIWLMTQIEISSRHRPDLNHIKLVDVHQLWKFCDDVLSRAIKPAFVYFYNS